MLPRGKVTRHPPKTKQKTFNRLSYKDLQTVASNYLRTSQIYPVTVISYDFSAGYVGGGGDDVGKSPYIS